MSEQLDAIWNGWTHNFLGSEGGFIVHAFNATAWDDDRPGIRSRGMRSLCGVRLAELGDLELDEVSDDGSRWEPCCIKCRRRLVAMGRIAPVSIAAIRALEPTP